MIYTDGTSELHIRLHIAEMLKDKVEQPNYSELCEKAYKFITNGIVLPPQEKDQFAEVMKNLTSGLTQAIQNGGNIVESFPKPQTETNEEENKLKELAEKYIGKHITYSEKPCYICGYSVEFDCLIAGTDYDIGKSINIDDSDCIIVSPRFAHYFYVPKDIVKE